MNVSLRPCRRCGHRGDCDLRRGVLAAVSASPLPVSLVNFRCKRRLESLLPGTIATTYLPVLRWQEGGPEDGAGWEVDAHADPVAVRIVVMEAAGSGKRAGRLLVYAPQHGENEDAKQAIFYRWPDELTPTGEMVPLCALCSRPLDAPLPDKFFIGCTDLGRHVRPEERDAALVELRAIERRQQGW